MDNFEDTKIDESLHAGKSLKYFIEQNLIKVNFFGLEVKNNIPKIQSYCIVA
jgi:hypothetical protein